MIETRDKIINRLHHHLQLPIIPNTETRNRPKYPFVDYNVITLIPFNGAGNYSWGGNNDDVAVIKETQPKVSISFNSYSRDETEAYTLAKQVYDYFSHIGVTELEGIAVVSVSEIANRTILEIDKYEVRYGLDVIFRFKDSITRIDPEIKSYSIEREEFQWDINKILKLI